MFPLCIFFSEKGLFPDPDIAEEACPIVEPGDVCGKRVKRICGKNAHCVVRNCCYTLS